MKTQKLMQFGAALVVIVAIIVVANTIANRKPEGKAIQFFPTLTEATIGSITMTDASGSVKVFKKGDVWQVAANSLAQATATQPVLDNAKTTELAGYPADSASVVALNEKIVGMKREILISEKPSNQALFEVDSAKGVTVEVFDNTGKSQGAVVIGKSGSDFSSNYVRSIGSAKVYSVSGSIRYSFFTELNRWKDKTITKFDKASAKKITLVKETMQLVLEKGSDSAATWTMTIPETSKVKADVVNTLLETASRFVCADWETSVNNPDSLGFSKPALVMTIALANGDKKTITVGNKKAGTTRFWVRAQEGGSIFLVEDIEIQKFDKAVADFKNAPAAPVAKP